MQPQFIGVHKLYFLTNALIHTYICLLLHYAMFWVKYHSNNLLHYNCILASWCDSGIIWLYYTYLNGIVTSSGSLSHVTVYLPGLDSFTWHQMFHVIWVQTQPHYMRGHVKHPVSWRGDGEICPSLCDVVSGQWILALGRAWRIAPPAGGDLWFATLSLDPLKGTT